MKLLESNGAMAERIQNQQQSIWETIQKLFPEIVLMEILKSGGQISGVGIQKKLIEITTNINYARGEIKDTLESLNELIGWLIFNFKIKTQIQFEDIIPKSFEDIMSEVSKATGILSKKWQLDYLQNKGVINSTEEELKLQNEENQSNPMGW